MKSVRLKDIAIINPKNNEDFENEFYYIDLGCVKNGKANFGEKINNLGKPSRAQRILNNNDILFQTVRPYQRNNLLYKKANDDQVVCSTGYAQLRTYQQVDYNYLYQLLSTDKFNFLVSLRCTGTNYPAINSNDLAHIQIGFHTEITKQKQIGNLLSTMDKLIEDKEELIIQQKNKKKYILNDIFNDSNQHQYVKLGDLTHIQTGNKDVKDATEDGSYNFYVRSKTIMKINEYAYDGEAIMLGGDGKIDDLLHYYYGKFNYHQRVYKITSDIYNIKYLYYSLEHGIGRHLMRSSAKTTVDSVRLPILKSYPVHKLDSKTQDKIANLLSSMDKLINNYFILFFYHFNNQLHV